MSLLRTRTIHVGSLLAFTADPNVMAGVSLTWGDPTHLALSRNDVVQVLEVNLRADSTWAKVLVLVVKGKRAGRTGHVSIDLGSRVQRCWQALTLSGSMAPVRAPSPAHPKSSPPSGTRTKPEDDDDTEGKPWRTAS